MSADGYIARQFSVTRTTLFPLAERTMSRLMNNYPYSSVAAEMPVVPRSAAERGTTFDTGVYTAPDRGVASCDIPVPVVALPRLDAHGQAS
jgi:hypothetical protein